MKNSLPEPNVIHQYLLGRFDEQDERENALSEQILFNDDLAELVESVEDEIIEEYLDGNLDPTDRKDVEGYFLRAPERKEKLRFARVLRGYFKTKQTVRVNPVVPYWRTRLRPSWPYAALILLAIVALSYISRIRHREALLEAQIMRQTAPSANLAPTAPPVHAAVAVLTLDLGRLRDIGTPIPRIEITRSTQRLIVEIVLSSNAPGPYDVQLESNETKGVIWSARLLPLISPYGARLLFEVPEEHIKSGTYFFSVSSGETPTTRPQSSDFQVRVTR
ncbi:MAG TPA: hypothetical protein VJP02_21885 [Candidatus Sulfotelmatobacter sp.]|nr:hypothetical protein [Candidatus Sulfotelmatobacter sp.]